MKKQKYGIHVENGEVDEQELDAMLDKLFGEESEEEKALPEPSEEEVNAILDAMFPDGWDLSKFIKDDEDG
ncbi:MAG: hypothetical protein HPY45_13395 [Anaerolineae bacterium]|nr:hypothetical protein [Anaerolineae bacterium]